MKKRILSMILVFCMIFTLLPGNAFAGEIGSVDSTAGDFQVSGGVVDTDYSYADHVLTILSGMALTISGTTTADRIVVQSGITANITLSGVDIQLAGDDHYNNLTPFGMTGATVNLTLTGTNVLKAGNTYAGLCVPEGAVLTITADSTGSLDVTGGSESAGIGGSMANGNCGTVTINGGTITATGGYRGAGIGGGSTGNGGTVSITGGSVNAVGSTETGAQNIGHGCDLYNEAVEGTLKGIDGVDLNRTVTTVALDGVTESGIAVTDLTVAYNLAQYSYSTAGMKTMADGKLYLWLPANATVSKVIADNKDYTGGVTSGGTGTFTCNGTIKASVTASDGTVTKHVDFVTALLDATGSSGSTLTMLSDAVPDSEIDIASKMTLDLNGHTLDMGSNCLRVDYYDSLYGELTITDSSTGKTGVITSNSNTLLISGKLTINSGTIQTTGANCFALICSSNAEVVINGGTFIGTQKDVAFANGAKSLVINGGTYTSSGLQANAAGVKLKGGTFSSIQSPDSAAADSLLSDGYCYYQGSSAEGTEVAGSERNITGPVTVGEIDWSGAVTYDAATKTYTVLSAEGLRWISGVCNGTITEDTYQKEPQLPEDTWFAGYTVKLANAIDLSGKNWIPIKFFGGTFDGAGYNITNMSVNVSDDSHSVEGGFFADLGGPAKNLSVSGNVNVTGGESSTVYAGGIAAIVNCERADGSLYNCFADVDVSITVASGQSGEAGGLSGVAIRAEVFNCISKGTVTVNGAGTSVAGALLGRGALDVLMNCYVADGTLVGNNESSTYTAVGTYDTSTGSLTATDGTTLTYGSDLKTAVKYWVNRQGADAVNYVTWTTNTIPVLTTTYAAVPETAYSNWEKQQDGSYTRTDFNTGLKESAEACVTNADTETPYGTLEEAIAAVQSNNGSKVTLLKDVTTESKVTINSGTFTIDLNNKTWTYQNSKTYGMLDQVSSGDITIENGNTTGGAVVERAGTLIINNVALSNSNSEAVLVLSGKLTFNSGSVKVTNSDFSVHGSDCSMQINGGTFEGANRADIRAGKGTTLEVKAGEIKGTLEVNSSASAILTGGRYGRVLDTRNNIGRLLGTGYAYRYTSEGTPWVQNTAISEVSNITVQLAPAQITAQPQDVSATYGYSSTEALVLNIKADKIATAADDISYQWYRVKSGSEVNDTAVGTDSSAYPVPAGLGAGTYHYYCAVTCDGYTVNSSTATFTVNKAEGSIANKEAGSGYAAAYTYTGSSVAEPLTEEFTTNSGGAVTFTWYTGDSTTEADLLTAAPSHTGTYTLKAEAAGTDNYTAASTTVKVTISYLNTDATAALFGILEENGWYTSDVTVSAPENYSIAASNGSEAVWGGSLTVNTDSNGAYTYYLKQIGTEYITDAKTVTIKRDTTAPETGTITYSEHQSFLGWLFHRERIDVTIPVSDTFSGVDHISYVLAPIVSEAQTSENGTPQAQTASVDSDGNAVITIEKNFKGMITVTAYDKAGNASAQQVIAKLAVEDTAPTLTVNDGTAEFTDNYYTTAQTLHISAADTESGLQSVTYTVDGGSVQSLFLEADTDGGLVIDTGKRTITALEGTHTYVITATDNALNTSTKTVTIHQDTVAPALNYVISPASSKVTDTTAAIKVTASEAGSLYYLAKESGTAPTIEELFATTAHDMTAGKQNTISLSGLKCNTAYTIYVVAKDKAGNQTTTITELTMETSKTSLAGAEVTLTKNNDPLDGNIYVYNGTSQIPDVTVSVGGTTLDADQYNISYSNSSTGSDNTTDAGTVTVTVTAKEDSNDTETSFDYTGTATASYVIAKKSVTVTAANATKQYGQVNPALALVEPIAAGQLIGDDTIADLHITLSTTAGTASEAGNYPITGTGNSANYEVTVNAGTLTITKIDAVLTVAATAITKTYGDKAFSLGVATAGTAALSCQSSSTAVATVNSAGTVTIKGCGVTTITVTAAGTSYNPVVKTITLTVDPKTMGTPSLKSPAGKKLTVTWKKDSKASGYQIAYSTSSKFTAKTTKTVTVKSYKTLKKTISKLKSGKKYYVHIRSYKSSGNTTVYSGWSKTAKLKVK